MKTSKISLGLFILMILTASAAYAQQTYIQTVTKLNTGCNYQCSRLDVPELNNNPAALIFVTPVLDKGRDLNPHPIGANYRAYEKKWSIFNLDGAAIVEGAKFKVEYYLSQDSDRFVYVFQGGTPCIDRVGLNNNPNAQLRFFATGAPNGAIYNKDYFNVAYDSAVRKWCITNVNNNPVPSGTAYNIVITSGGAVGTIAPIPAPAPTPTPTISTTPVPKPSATAQPVPAPPTTLTPPPIGRPPTEKSIQLGFGKLNDFVDKGLPEPAAPPTDDLDMAAVTMARQISKSDEKSLPVLLAALQTAGLTIIDEKGKVLLKAVDGKGQGLGFYDFEAVGALKLANRGVGTSLIKITATITKETPQITASQFAESMLQDLRAQADNSANAYLRFWARLIIELGRSTPQPVDLMTVSPNNANLSVLQATLLTRRLQGDFYVLKTRLKQTGEVHQPSFLKNSFALAAWREDSSLFSTIPLRVAADLPCELDGDQSLVLDGSAVLLTYAQGKAMEMIGNLIKSAGGQAAFGKLGVGLIGANIALGWLKLVAAVTMLKGEITVDNAPLIRTTNADINKAGNRRLMKARIWSEVGQVQMLNCVRKYINVTTGLDFNLPTDGPVSGTAIEWHFAGDSETIVNDANTRNIKRFVNFESPAGNDKNPQKQVTDDNGISQMYLVGAPKVPYVGDTKNTKVPKTASVLVGVTLKSAQNPAQQFIDILGGGLGIATAGPLGILALIPEIVYRVPLVPASAEIPVIDHEPCDGQWQGTITYVRIETFKANKTYTNGSPRPGTRGAGATGNRSRSERTVTLSGTISVNGRGGIANYSADEVFVSNESSAGKMYCHGGLNPGPLVGYGSQGSFVGYGSGDGTEAVFSGIYLDKDYYRISLIPPTVHDGQYSSTTQYSPTGGCSTKPSTSASVSSQRTYGTTDYIEGKAKFGVDRDILSGSDTTTRSTPSDAQTTVDNMGGTQVISVGTTIVSTITWNLRRCN